MPKYVFRMPYVPEISKNSCKFSTGGIKPHVRKWMDDLAQRIIKANVPPLSNYVVGIHGHFLDERRPDIPNFFDIVLDAVEDGLGINDKFFRARDDGYETGYVKPELVITIEGVEPLSDTFLEVLADRTISNDRFNRGFARRGQE